MASLLNEYQKAMGELIDGRSYSDARSRVAEWWEGKPRFVLIIDEINRGDISKILGELITLLEMDKRLGMDNELVVTLPYSRERFAVPPNLYIIGTMNTADKSIALLDIALRRRFGFIEMAPDFPLLRTSWSEIHANQAGTEVERLFKESVSAVERINTRIASNHSIGRDKRIGHAFFFKATSLDDLIMIWNNEIIPLLEEYCYGRYELMSELVFGRSVPAWFSMERGFRSIDTPADLAEFLGVGIADGQK
jgi:5-methylcytosine-specific restriction protein B